MKGQATLNPHNPKQVPRLWCCHLLDLAVVTARQRMGGIESADLAFHFEPEAIEDYRLVAVEPDRSAAKPMPANQATSRTATQATDSKRYGDMQWLRVVRR